MIQSPMWVDLTPNGKTLVAVYPSPVQGKLVAACLNTLGEPEMICTGETNPETVLILFPHQDMPEELYEASEWMTTQSLLHYLGFDTEGGTK